MKPTPSEFSEWIQRAQAGDKGAFGHLLDHYVGKLQHEAQQLIGRQLRQLVDPADLIQATRLILWQGLSRGKFQIESPQKLLALAKIILRRQAARVCRALKPELTAKTLEFRFSETLSDISIRAATDSRDSTEDAEFEQAVERLLGSLCAVDRNLIRLRLLGYTTARVAQEMQLDAAFLRLRLGRLRKRLTQFGALQRMLADA